MPGESSASAQMRTAIRAKLPNELLRARTRLIYARSGRWRVFENRSDKEDRLNPARTQCGNIIGAQRNRRHDQQRYRRVIIVARGDECYRASVLRAVCVRMNALVQLRRSAERQRPEKSGRREDRDRSTEHRAAFHWGRLSLWRENLATVFWKLEIAVQKNSPERVGAASCCCCYLILSWARSCRGLGGAG